MAIRAAILLCALMAFSPLGAPSPVRAAEAAALGPVTNLPIPRFVSIRASTANARRGPGLDHRIDWAFVRRGLPVEVVAEYGHWRRVRDIDGEGGWVHHSLLSGVRTGLITGDAPIELYAGPNDRTALRALAEPGVVVRLTECEAEWCAVRADRTKGWMRRDQIWGLRPGEEFD